MNPIQHFGKFIIQVGESPVHLLHVTHPCTVLFTISKAHIGVDNDHKLVIKSNDIVKTINNNGNGKETSITLYIKMKKGDGIEISATGKKNTNVVGNYVVSVLDDSDRPNENK
jgi:predicted ABC-type transport system involved in lysophospholipase L1 biosynthesis ATPase subunit